MTSGHQGVLECLSISDATEDKTNRKSSLNVEEPRPIARAMHDLCQPLTTLQFRLEMAKVLGTPEAYREAVDLGLTDCACLMDAAFSMRKIVEKLDVT